MYDSRTIANYFLHLARLDDVKITPMKLQKLVYFAHGHYLAVTGEPLINDCVQAWQYGPVIPSLYHSIKHYGRNPIDEKIVDTEFDLIEEIPSDPIIRGFLDKIWMLYGKLTAIQLSKMTHEPGSPWDQVWEKYKTHSIIPEVLIEAFFKSGMKTAHRA